MRRLYITYALAFLGALLVWFGFVLIEAQNPILPWTYPVLIPFTGLIFPGGTLPELLMLNHILETWFPFLVAWTIARIRSRGAARFRGAVILYVLFVMWSFVLGWLVLFGLSFDLAWNIGFFGTMLGGALLYRPLIEPDRRARQVSRAKPPT